MTEAYSKNLQKVIDKCNARKFPSSSDILRLTVCERVIANHYVECLSSEHAAKFKKLFTEE